MTNANPPTNVYALNSSCFLGRAKPYLKIPNTIIWYRDNNEASRATLNSLREQKKILGNPVIIDGSHIFLGYKGNNLRKG